MIFTPHDLRVDLESVPVDAARCRTYPSRSALTVFSFSIII
jgi:hypothetical protein